MNTPHYTIDTVRLFMQKLDNDTQIAADKSLIELANECEELYRSIEPLKNKLEAGEELTEAENNAIRSTMKHNYKTMSMAIMPDQD